MNMAKAKRQRPEVECAGANWRIMPIIIATLFFFFKFCSDKTHWLLHVVEDLLPVKHFCLLETKTGAR